MAAHSTITTASIIDAALAIVDESGLPTVTIRSVAHRVGAPPMTLYAHFKGKDVLLDLMFAEVARLCIETQAALAGRPNAVRSVTTSGRLCCSILAGSR
ncbi:MAG TPA: TetR/AcrR family transcriptional regulator [Polyangiaceae bacterium]|nr:TetR/AcrR family transcriptional regulator [Polyangiaceae bacterium]